VFIGFQNDDGSVERDTSWHPPAPQ